MGDSGRFERKWPSRERVAVSLRVSCANNDVASKVENNCTSCCAVMGLPFRVTGAGQLIQAKMRTGSEGRETESRLNCEGA